MLGSRSILTGFLAAGLLMPAAAALATDSPSKSIADAYESTRAALADDDLAKAQTAAAALAKAASAETADEHLRHHQKPIAESAAAFGKSKDIGAARLVFGDISKAFIALVAADKSLGASLHAFACPMAKGYKKWVQPTTGVSNPYMGKAMGTCGAKTEMKP